MKRIKIKWPTYNKLTSEVTTNRISKPLWLSFQGETQNMFFISLQVFPKFPQYASLKKKKKNLHFFPFILHFQKIGYTFLGFVRQNFNLIWICFFILALKKEKEMENTFFDSDRYFSFSNLWPRRGGFPNKLLISRYGDSL